MAAKLELSAGKKYPNANALLLRKPVCQFAVLTP
jgi:hypothetical protein